VSPVSFLLSPTGDPGSAIDPEDCRQAERASADPVALRYGRRARIERGKRKR